MEYFNDELYIRKEVEVLVEPELGEKGRRHQMRIIRVPRGKQIEHAIKSGDPFDIQMNAKYRIIYADEKGKEKCQRNKTFQRFKWNEI